MSMISHVVRDHFRNTVMPAKAGIQSFVNQLNNVGLGTGLRRYDDFQNTSIGAPPRSFMAGTPRQCSIFTLNG